MTTILAIIAILVSLGALGVAFWQGCSSRRSADTAEEALKTAQEAAAHAKASADAAERVAQAEVGRDHEMYKPKVNGGCELESTGWGNPDRDALVYLFTLDRDYEVMAWVKRDDGARAEARVRKPDREDRDWKILLDEVPRGQRETRWERLEVRFWPPQAVAGRAVPWTCRCEGELVPGDRAGHWEWDFRIDPQIRPRSRDY